ncbi:hypothetical protein [Arthrobacter sp. HLT1-20]
MLDQLMMDQATAWHLQAVSVGPNAEGLLKKLSGLRELVLP